MMSGDILDDTLEDDIMYADVVVSDSVTTKKGKTTKKTRYVFAYTSMALLRSNLKCAYDGYEIRDPDLPIDLVRRTKGFTNNGFATWKESEMLRSRVSHNLGKYPSKDK